MLYNFFILSAFRSRTDRLFELPTLPGTGVKQVRYPAVQHTGIYKTNLGGLPHLISCKPCYLMQNFVLPCSEPFPVIRMYLMLLLILKYPMPCVAYLWNVWNVRHAIAPHSLSSPPKCSQHLELPYKCIMDNENTINCLFLTFCQ